MLGKHFLLTIFLTAPSGSKDYFWPNTEKMLSPQHAPSTQQGTCHHTVYVFEHFFEMSPDLLCIAGFDGYFKRINPAVANVLEYSMEELLSRPIDEFVHPDDRGLTRQKRSGLIKGEPLLDFENRYITKSGKIIWLSWTSMNVDSEQLVYAVAKNITSKKAMEEERNALLVNLTRNNNELRELTYTTSHNLRSPVNNLLAIFGLMDMTKIDHEETVEFINILQTASKALKQTLNDYVDILAQHEGIRVHVESLDLHETLTSVLQSIHSLLIDSRAIINADFSKQPGVVFNKAYLQSIFLNLITNSIKYAQQGIPALININSDNINGRTQLIISDNGSGFDMEKVKDKIFGMHQQFHDHPDSKGIGLYLVYNHVTAVGGKITVDSEPNEGTRFTITL